MKKYFYIIMSGMLTFSLMSCDSKSARMEKLNDLVEQLADDSKEYSEEQLEKLTKEYSETLEGLKEYDDLSPEEVKEMARIQGRYASAMLKQGGKALDKNMEKAGKALEGFMEGLKDRD